MQKSMKNSRAKLFSLLGISEVHDFDKVFELIVGALATICRSLDRSDLRAALKSIKFRQAEELLRLPDDELESLSKLVKAREESLHEEEIYSEQVMVQRMISPPTRKRLAAYYTKPVGLELMARLVADSARTRRLPLVLADPFLGSGLTITSALKRLDISIVGKVWGVEPHPLPALIAYSAILHSLEGDCTRIQVAVGDMFRSTTESSYEHSTSVGGIKSKNASKADIIIANPPFTRWELLEEDYRELLWNVTEKLGYSKYVARRQLNLQVASLFLMDHLLEDNGLLVSVLPASTFYTLYGEAAKRLLMEKYQINALIENESDTSFSIDSGLKEVILLANKGKQSKPSKTAFAAIEPGDLENIQRIRASLSAPESLNDGVTWVDLQEQSSLAQTNWSVFFANAKLRETMFEILSKATKNETIGTWDTLYGGESIFRGIEMYGPDFFFVPNRHWVISEEHGHTVHIQNHENESELILPKEYLVPALRRPGLYLDTIRPTVRHYVLSIPARPSNEFPEDLAKYIDWGKRKSTGQPAMKLFGDLWYSHVNKQLRVKKPFGRVFLPDKVDPSFRNRGLFASYNDTPLAASKNFHIVSLNDATKDKLLVAWFNSTLFISYFILAGRKITRSWSRLLEDSYLKMPIINLSSINKRDLERLEKAFESMLERKLPPIKQQLTADYRHQIDMILLEMMGIGDPEKILDQVYLALQRDLR